MCIDSPTAKSSASQETLEDEEMRLRVGNDGADVSAVVKPAVSFAIIGNGISV
jgi:hypothetical protein